MTDTRPSLYRRYRFPPEIIGEAVWLYFRFPLSFRMVEDMLAYKGIIFTHKTVREWAEKFGCAYTNKIRRSFAWRGSPPRLSALSGDQQRRRCRASGQPSSGSAAACQTCRPAYGP